LPPPQSPPLRLVLRGADIKTSSSLECMFSTGTTAPATWLNSTAASCVVPAHSSPATTTVALTVNSQEPLTNALSFEYVSLPTIDSIEPVVGGRAGGAIITVTGSSFLPSAYTMCDFDGILLPSSYISPSEITCVSPPGHPTDVNTTLVVTVDGGSTFSSSYETFRYNDVRVVSVSPPSGSVAGGNSVTVIGTGFEDSVHLKCHFGPYPAASVTLVSSTEIVCVAPEVSVVGSVPLEVSVNGNAEITEDLVQYSFTADMSVSALSPLTGAAAGGTSVLVRGYNFPDAPGLTCRFNSSPLGDVPARFISSTEIECTAPSIATLGLSNPLAVSFAVSGNGESFPATTSTFTYTPAASATSVTPSFGSLSGGTAVSVAGTGFEFTPSSKCRFGTTAVDAGYVSPTE
ncbi:hypothetical protein TeGR_g15237, partial [Tetraparma gracilis]